MIDVFEKYKNYYSGYIVRPQPTDFILEYFKNKKSKGFFIDVGANDGITWSNTLALSECLGWEGICIEPHPLAFEKLLVNRPNDLCLNLGSHSNNSAKTFWRIEGYAEMLSGFQENYDPKHIERIYNDIRVHGGQIITTEIAVEKLEKTIKENNVASLDYLSIDVEGAELDVLYGLNIKENTPQLISIEDNGYTQEPHNFLINNKYNFISKVAGDCFYEKSSVL